MSNTIFAIGIGCLIVTLSGPVEDGDGLYNAFSFFVFMGIVADIISFKRK